MTLNQFLAELSKTPRDWHLSYKWNAIRRGGPFGSACCPITSLSGVSADDWQTEAKCMGLDGNDAYEVMRAADNEAGFNPALRSRLLAACGIKE